jgi:hypothetical protein
MNRLIPATILIACSCGLSACYGPTPPPPQPRGRSLDIPPRYGVPEQETRYFDGANMGDPNSAAVMPPDPNAPITGDTVTPPPTDGSTIAPPPVSVTPPTSTPPPAPSPAPPPAPAEIPFATRIEGKPGFVKSPFDPSGQAIDARDFQSGQKARCPYTGKIFRVP